MPDKRQNVCPVEHAGSLDNIFRRWIHNPKKILRGLIREGMCVLDIGCGSGLYSLEMARMVGETGTVIAADLQEGMLKKLEHKIRGTEIEERIKLHKCRVNKIGIKEQVDFILAFYMVHEVPDRDRFMSEISSILKPGGIFLIIEPPFHVSKKNFSDTINRAAAKGLKPLRKHNVLFSKALVLKK